MPVFEFRCESCNQDFEKLVFSRSATVSCPRCDCDEVCKRPSLFGTAGTDKKVSAGAACSGCSSGSCASCGHV